jgi:hypothetical protein
MTCIRQQCNTDNRVDKRFLIGVFIFGLGAAATGNRWLATGRPIAETIKKGDLLYYPLCDLWLMLGLAMIALAVLAFVSSREIFLRLAAYSCLAYILLGFGTLAASLSYAP